MATTVHAQNIRVREHLRPMFEFDHVGDFENGLAVVFRGSEVAVVDVNCEFVIPFRFDPRFFRDVGFSDGFIALYDAETSRFGYYNAHGEQVIDYRFVDARPFSEGLAAVRLDTVQWGFIDIVGDVVIPPAFLDARGLREGLAAVFHSKGWGFVDSDGNMVVYPEYSHVSDFEDGFATVYVWETQQFGFIDTYGNNIAWFEYLPPGVWVYPMELPRFSDGLITFSLAMDDGQVLFGYMDTTGNVVISPMFNFTTRFSDGRAIVWVDERAGIIDISGDLVMLPVEMDRRIAPFSEGRAAFTVGEWPNETVGFLDVYGNEIIAPVFMQARDFSEGLAAVRTDDGWGFIDKYGNIVVATRFDAVTNFSEGFAWFLQDGRWGTLEIYERSVVMPVILSVFGVAVVAALWVFKRMGARL